MELKDFVVTPIVLFIVYVLAYIIRPKVTDQNTRRYFIPALTVKIIGAIGLGLVYQFYYGGGDTFNYHTHGSRHVWDAFQDSFANGFKLLFANGKYETGIYNYASKIWYFRDPSSYFVLRLVAIIDLFTFSTYSATAVIFSCLSFSGLWALYLTFEKKYPTLHLWLAMAILFVPSVFFWGSGILKDTVTLGCLAWMTYCFHELFIKRKWSLVLIFIFIASAFFIYQIKIYILLSVLPAMTLWFFIENIFKIRSYILRILLAPLFLLMAGTFGYFSISAVGEENSKYSLDNVAKTAQITAYDIRYGWGAREGAGGGYTLGELDGTFTGMVKLAPQAINVSLFRPYLWEVQNPLMLLSALEGLVLMFLTLFVIFKVGIKSFFRNLFKPDVIFCFTFSLIFAFAVGISTYNFGTLSRYKIPLMPFYLIGLTLLYYHSNKERKFSALEETE